MSDRLVLSLWEPPISPEAAREIFWLDAGQGAVYWRETGKGRHAKRASRAGFKKGGERYMRVKLRGRLIALHRLVWCLQYGVWPDGLIDHINGDPSDNRIANLRLADKRLNAENQRRARADNATGVLGVRAHGEKFRAQIRTGGQTIYLGLFSTSGEAHAAYVEAKRRLHEGCTL